MIQRLFTDLKLIILIPGKDNCKRADCTNLPDRIQETLTEQSSRAPKAFGALPIVKDEIASPERFRDRNDR